MNWDFQVQRLNSMSSLSPYPWTLKDLTNTHTSCYTLKVKKKILIRFHLDVHSCIKLRMPVTLKSVCVFYVRNHSIHSSYLYNSFLCQISLTWFCYSRLQYCPTSLYGEACNVSLCCWTQLTAGVPLNRLTGSHMTGAPRYGSLAVKQLGVNLGQPAEILLWTEYLELETHNEAHRSVLRTIHMRYQLNASALPHPNLWVLKDFIGTNQPIIK